MKPHSGANVAPPFRAASFLKYSIAGLELPIIFKEVQSDLTKISVRSRGAVDAAALCALFGGGGHIRAAGAEIEKPMDDAVKLVLGAAKEAIVAASPQA